MYLGQIRHGIWTNEYRNSSGEAPSAFESAQAATLGYNKYLFGGFGREIFNEMRYFNSKTVKWSLIKTNGDVPLPRAGHSMVTY